MSRKHKKMLARIIVSAALLVACALLYLKLCRSEERFMEL